MINVEPYLFAGEIPKLQGVIPLYEELIDIENDEELRMVMDMFTDTGHEVIKLKFQMEMGNLASQSTQLKDVHQEPVSNASLPPEVETLHGDKVVDFNVSLTEQDMNAFEALHEDRGPVRSALVPLWTMNALPKTLEELNWRDNYNIPDDGLDTNYVADANDGDSEDDLSEYSSSDNDNFKSLSDLDETNKDALGALSDEIMRNYFQQKDESISELDVGVTFDDVYHFRRVMKEFAIHEDFPLEKIKLHFRSKTYNPDHTCDPFGKGSKDASAKWIAEKMKDEFESNLFTDVNTISMNLKKRNALRRQDDRIFIKLKCEGLDISNPLSSCRFERLFVCFPAQRDGFKYGCHPFIGIDGCFLKGPYGGQLLVATVMDANFGIFPLAFMFAETESEATWGEKNIPIASNRYCARHRYNNFKAKYPGPKLRFLFWKAVRATNITDFKMIMDEIKSVNEEASQWLLRDDPKHWSLHAFDIHVKADHVTNSMTESFNGWICKIRQLPLLSLMEALRRKCMKRFRSRFEKGTTWESNIHPEVRKKFNLARRAVRHIYGLSNGDEYEVDDDKTYIMSLSQKTCQCREWQLCGIPCKHAMACIYNKQADPLDFVHPYFSKEAYLRTYKDKIPIVPDKIHWPEVKHPLILSPIKMRGKDKQGKDKQTWRGRPFLNRRREADEPPKKRKRSNVVHYSKMHKNES
ncbi:hypothetical protein BUALT_Bualt13G0077200 [Buddleja alternifolia]|uniref:SWIM-type domain-containing protein n=1 Tax=Buddleja alternifolia TaxID=168488 RepID=A0AAV6WSB8_9LAMI|nr:hypothetical protein BUALT_Bualt13G0077200 [Buddleja alternifolia]